MTLEGAPHLRAEHLPVFDCANPCGRIGKRSLSVESHIRMMAAVQPFISGAISKTINMPNSAGVKECGESYMLFLEAGIEGQRALPRRLQAVAAAGQPGAAVRRRRDEARNSPPPLWPPAPPSSPSAIVERVIEKVVRSRERERLPQRRKGYTQKAIVGGHKVYLRTGEYDDGPRRRDLHRHAQGRRRLPQPDEQFRHRRLHRPAIRRAAGRICGGLHLHHASSRRALVIGNDSIKNATSVLDYIFREMAVSYLEPQRPRPCAAGGRRRPRPW